MTKFDRQAVILEKLATADSVIYILKKDWSTTVDTLFNFLHIEKNVWLGNDLFYSKTTWNPKLPSMTIWYGRVGTSWEPFCAIIDFCGRQLGAYYNEV